MENFVLETFMSVSFITKITNWQKMPYQYFSAVFAKKYNTQHALIAKIVKARKIVERKVEHFALF